MARIRYEKWSYWIPQVGVLFCLFAVITAQPGFLSINCGGKTNHTGANNITWVTDANYIDVGETADIGNITQQAFGSSLYSLRFFPKPLNKSCYQLPVPSNVPYLLRLWFIIGNYNGFQRLPSFAYSFETVDMLAMNNITLTDNGFYDEIIFVTSGTVMYVCLIRTFESDDPFISGIELRPLRDGMYAQAMPGTVLILDLRIDVGGKSVVRYPLDNFDRIWTTNISLDYGNASLFRSVSSEERISTNNTEDLPPTAVMQTAWVQNGVYLFSVSFGSAQWNKSLLLLYFTEVETLDMSEDSSFNVEINWKTLPEPITPPRNYSALELIFVSDQLDSFALTPTVNATRPPLINAFEHYWLLDTQPPTYLQDIEALDAIKTSFDIKDWISDPCYLIHWKGISCDNSSSAIRISEIDLSGRNLTGSLPKEIEQLTALVNVSLNNNYLMGPLPNFSNLTMLERLDLQNNNMNGTVPEWLSQLKNLKELSLNNNYLTGPLPNFSNLTMLERIYLQNNNINGTVPEWLSQLKNLKELNIENNNFRGVIPAQLLHNCSLKFNYSGNPYLRMGKRECVPDNSKKNKSKVIVGTAFSGILIIALALMVAIAVHRNKCRKKEQDYSIIMMPNTTNSRAFTLHEIVAATKNYNRKIGQGGFGSVFLGKLPEGRVVAVKVLSLFSKQGVHEFLNEVDLLSKINHNNLVSLLGYCNETREVMLIYDYMSGGSLKDHLYGPSSEESEQSWKTRLKIALDAAQGLEYLHVGSTPKIIHRDIKTANILLDSNMKGKLADFGLSKMTVDGEATHVTTAVKGTLGYLDPEYYNTQKLTEKSDVYSFGVVLLEIICGRQPIEVNLPEDEVNIIRWVTPCVLDMDENPGRIAEIIDKRLDGSYDLKSITCVAKVAMRCVQSAPSLRPSVTEVVRELEKAMKIEYKVSISHDIGIKSSDLLVGSLSLSMDSRGRKGMEWRDNSSNFSKVGR